MQTVAGVVPDGGGDELGWRRRGGVRRSVPRGADGAGGRGPGVQPVLHPGLQQLHRRVGAGKAFHAQQLLLLAESHHGR